MTLDAIDKKLLDLLQSDSRKTVKAYALELGLSTTAVYERIKKLERNGLVKGYVALVDKKRLGLDFTVFCHVRLAQHNKDQIAHFEREVLKLTEVTECYHVSGDYDYLLKVQVRDMESYRSFMVTKLTGIQHIGNTQTAFAIDEVKYTTALPMV